MVVLTYLYNIVLYMLFHYWYEQKHLAYQVIYSQPNFYKPC